MAGILAGNLLVFSLGDLESPYFVRTCDPDLMLVFIRPAAEFILRSHQEFAAFNLHQFHSYRIDQAGCYLALCSFLLLLGETEQRREQHKERDRKPCTQRPAEETVFDFWHWFSILRWLKILPGAWRLSW